MHKCKAVKIYLEHGDFGRIQEFEVGSGDTLTIIEDYPVIMTLDTPSGSRQFVDLYGIRYELVRSSINDSPRWIRRGNTFA